MLSPGSLRPARVVKHSVNSTHGDHYLGPVSWGTEVCTGDGGWHGVEGLMRTGTELLPLPAPAVADITNLVPGDPREQQELFGREL